MEFVLPKRRFNGFCPEARTARLLLICHQNCDSVLFKTENFDHNTWSVQKVVTYIRVSIFCGVMLVLIPLTYADMFGHCECSVNF